MGLNDVEKNILLIYRQRENLGLTGQRKTAWSDDWCAERRGMLTQTQRKCISETFSSGKTPQNPENPRVRQNGANTC